MKQNKKRKQTLESARTDWKSVETRAEAEA